jgi:hypothetical protein
MPATTTVGVDDALNYILQHLRTKGPATYGQDGYDFTVRDMTVRYLREVAQLRPAPEVEDERTYAASAAFFDAAWELSRRGVLRPSVRTSFMQWAARASSGGGYTLTQIGAEWLAGLGDTRLEIRAAWGPLPPA